VHGELIRGEFGREIGTNDHGWFLSGSTVGKVLELFQRGAVSLQVRWKLL
jgi:hypothetical protein